MNYYPEHRTPGKYFFKEDDTEPTLTEEQLATELGQKYDWFMHEAAVQESESTAINSQWV
jgi:hypothetical protein